LKKLEMKNAAKKVLVIIVIVVFLFGSGFGCGYFTYRNRNTGNTHGITADVRNYDEAAERVERAAGAVSDAARNVGEAAGEIRISIEAAGRIGEIAGDIRDGVEGAASGAGELADRIQRVMGILDAAEKRSAENESTGNNGLD